MGKQATAKAVAPKPVTEAPTPTSAKGQPKGAHELTKAQQTKCKALSTVSARIRYLLGEGLSRSEISRAIPNASGDKLRYQHVNNVRNQMIAKAKEKS